ncbi:MAG TPA: hypothetical protein PKK26_18010, partial [Candidatus Wallbacteria bacterium]|nr:hypothetical protein [Candidatus Wallbacteria bacterium]
ENFQNGRALRLYLIAIILTGIFIYGGYIRLQDPASSPELALASIAREKINDKKPVIYVSSASIPYMFASADPVFLYHARMKGWIASAEEADQEYVSDKVKSGAGHLIGYYGFFAGPRGAARLKSLFDGNYKKIFDDGEKFIVRLYR